MVSKEYLKNISANVQLAIEKQALAPAGALAPSATPMLVLEVVAAALLPRVVLLIPLTADALVMP